MRRNSASSDTKLGEQMRELMSKRPINLVRAGLVINRSEVVITE